MEAAQHPRIVSPTVLRALSHKPPLAPGIASAATVGEALLQLTQLDAEALAVIDGERFAGIFSERNFAHFMANGGTLSASVTTAMSAAQPVAKPDDNVEYWLKQTDTIPFLPVIDGHRLLGLLSRTDLLAESDAHHRRVFQAIDLDHRIMFKRGTYSC